MILTLLLFIAGEQVEMISNPASHVEKVTNVDRVLRFMKANRIPMHPIRAEGTGILHFHKIIILCDLFWTELLWSEARICYSLPLNCIHVIQKDFLKKLDCFVIQICILKVCFLICSLLTYWSIWYSSWTPTSFRQMETPLRSTKNGAVKESYNCASQLALEKEQRTSII